MIRLGLIGGRGHVGQELLQLLDGSAHYRVVFAGSRSRAGQPVRDEFPGLQTDLVFSGVERETIGAAETDAWILAQDNGQAAGFVEMLEDRPGPVVDVSADHRFDPDWVYGLTQMNADQLPDARRVANPGCYATAIQLGLLPILDWLDESPPTAFGVSGYSGAGRKPGPRNDPRRLADNLIPYQLAGHLHQREASHHLGRPVRFAPHVAGFFRGISITLMARLAEPRTAGEIAGRFREVCLDWPLVDISDPPPEIAMVRETGLTRIGGFTLDPCDSSCLVWTSVLDNLRKGAASQVVENLNLIFGLPWQTELEGD